MNTPLPVFRDRRPEFYTTITTPREDIQRIGCSSWPLRMDIGKRFMASAVLARALAFAAAAFPVSVLLATAGEDAPASAGRTIPVAPVDLGSTTGRIVLGVADWLEQRVGSGSQGMRLALDAPMWAEERDGTVTLHLSGARLVEPSVPPVQWSLGDLAIAVAPQGEAAYDFELALPPAVDGGNARLTIGEGTVSGTWRSDLEIATRLEADVANLQLLRKDARSQAVVMASLGALSVADALAEGDDGLWDSRTALGLSDLEGKGFALGRLDISGRFEDFSRDSILELRGNFGAFTDGMGGPTALADILDPIIKGRRWGHFEMMIAVHDLGVSDGEEYSLGRLEWQVDLDGRTDLADLATRIDVADLRLGGKITAEMPPALIPRAATVDIAFKRLPMHRIADAFTGIAIRGKGPKPGDEPMKRAVFAHIADAFFGFAKRGETAEPGDELMREVILAHLDAADSSFEIQDIHIATPSSELRANGRIQVKPAGIFGVIGGMDARIRGLGTLMELAQEESEVGALVLLLMLQGLGKPVFEEGTREPTHVFEINLHRDGDLTVNDTSFDELFEYLRIALADGA